MKYIQKGLTPQELRRWFEGQLLPDGQRINCGYSDMPSDVKDVVKHSSSWKNKADCAAIQECV